LAKAAAWFAQGTDTRRGKSTSS